MQQPIPKPGFGNVIPSGARTPLQEFKGRLVSHEGKPVSGFGGEPRLDVIFTFDQLDVIQSEVPYLLPIGEVPITYKEKENTVWGMLGKSFAAVLGLESYKDVDIESTYGKVQHWKCTQHKYGERRVTGADGQPALNEEGQQIVEAITGPKWEVLAVEGMGGGKAKPKESPIKAALKLLDGKNAGDFYRAALQDRDIKADATLTDQIMNEAFVPAMVAVNAVTVDENGVHHVDWDKAPK